MEGRVTQLTNLVRGPINLRVELRIQLSDLRIKPANLVIVRDVPTAGSILGADYVAIQGAHVEGCLADQSHVLSAESIVAAAQLPDARART